MQSSHSAAKRAIHVLCVVGISAASSVFAEESTINVIYSFTGNNGTLDGNAPFAPLLNAGGGVFYGTTGYGGGSTNCTGGCGTLFRVNSDGTETVVYAFAGGTDGARPNAGVIAGPDGVLYGTTEFGGNGAGCQSATFISAYGYSGCGTVYEITSAAAENVIYSFQGTGEDGFNVLAGVVLGSNGNLYGSTASGGTYLAGNLFELTPAGVETVLYSFTGGSDGTSPNAVTLGNGGGIFGTANGGGASGLGTVFKLSAKGVFKILHTFTGGPGDGAYPETGLLDAGDGNFYGTTPYGGALGFGSLFKITASGTMTIAYSFTSTGGSVSPNGPLIENSAGTIFGTTEFGGTAGYGFVYEYSAGGFTTLVSLPGYPAGSANAMAGVTLGDGGNLYGTSSLGGAYDGGTVFKVKIN
jgi:uncharacterized repeat protein (TIGR03803 family)